MFKRQIENRVNFIKEILKKSGAKGIVFGNSGGKDSALTGILCKMACPDVLGVIMPCGSKQNYAADTEHALMLAEKFNIECIKVDLKDVKQSVISAIENSGVLLSQSSVINIAPRLRMTTLYAIAREKGYIVAGTGNKSENYMGYFTKWGDGAYDFNPIADLTVSEIYEMLKYLGAPRQIIDKPPSAGLFEGQTDEAEMGVSYAEIDEFLLKGIKGKNYGIIEKAHKNSEHKRQNPVKYGENTN